MNRVSIVPFSSLLELYSKSSFTNNMEALDDLDNAFEAGMVEVLKEVAFKELIYYENDRNNERKDTAADTKAIESFRNTMELCNNNEQKSALLDLEAALNHCTSIELEKHFIDGFILGYKFSKATKNIT